MLVSQAKSIILTAAGSELSIGVRSPAQTFLRHVTFIIK